MLFALVAVAVIVPVSVSVSLDELVALPVTEIGPVSAVVCVVGDMPRLPCSVL